MYKPKTSKRTVAALGSLLMGASLLATVSVSNASSHRDAPLIAQDPVADNTDVYAFVAPDAPGSVTLISNFIPLQEPAGGPNFYNFGDDVLYEIHVDNNGDAVADLSYQFRFQTTTVNGDTPLYNEGPISFEGGVYKNLNVRQTYTITEVNDGVSTELATNLVVPPANVGPRSTPNYEALAAAGVHSVALPGGGSMKVFAGPRDEAFPVDLGSIFDLGALRSLNKAHLIPLDTERGINATTGFNVHSIAMQIPKGRIVESDPVIGIHSTSSRKMTTTRTAGSSASDGDWVQISRLGQPLVNEVVVPLAAKDLFNGSVLSPGDSAFLPIVQDPRIGQLLPVLYPGAFAGCYPTAPRNDLVTIFLTGIEGVNKPQNVVPSEQLRLNTSTAPTPYASQNSLGLLAGQADGFPNGRRLIDDVVDIELQAIAGATPVGACNGKSPNNQLGDGVSGNDVPFLTTFPYLGTPQAGYDHGHEHTNNDAGADPAGVNRIDSIKRLYLAYFARGFDRDGLNYWNEQNLTVRQISEFFAASPELVQRYGNLDNRAFVDRLYLNVLGRNADQAGFTYWVGLLESGTSRGTIMVQFSDSPEFIKLVSAR